MKAASAMITRTEIDAIVTIVTGIDHRGIIETMTTAGIDGTDIPVEAVVVVVVSRTISETDATSTTDTTGRIEIAVAIARISVITTEIVTTEDLHHVIGRENQVMIKSGGDLDRGANHQLRLPLYLLK